MKKLLLALVTMLPSFFSQAENTLPHEYVSIDCPLGDISLTLENTGSFTVVLKHWDQELGKHTKEESMSGTWYYKDKELVLHSDYNVTYKRDKSEFTIGSMSASIDSFLWDNSSTPTFVDSFTLVERVAIDNLFTGVTSKK